jgi:hypothetical protein
MLGSVQSSYTTAWYVPVPVINGDEVWMTAGFIDEMGKNIENMLSNKKTSNQFLK